MKLHAAELAEMLQFLNQWLAHPGRLAAMASQEPCRRSAIVQAW